MDETLDRAVARIAEQHHGVFAMCHLDALDVSANERHQRLEAGRWLALHDGVYRIAGTPPSWKGNLLAACWAGATRAVASHRSAAALWDLPGRREDLVEITCPRWRRARHDGLLVHETIALDVEDTTIVSSIPVTTVERTIFDLCGLMTLATADLAVDNALRRELTTVDALNQILVRIGRRGRRGSAQFRAVMADRSGGDALPESAPERLLARALVRQGLPEPVPQFVILDRNNRFVARVDLAYPDAKIVIEYDSYQEHVGKAALVRDSARRNAIVASGYLPLTATAADLHDDASRLAAHVRRALQRAA